MELMVEVDFEPSCFSSLLRSPLNELQTQVAFTMVESRAQKLEQPEVPIWAGLSIVQIPTSVAT